MRRVRKRSRTEPVISLINIVFLILIFFMVAGTLVQPGSAGVEFVRTSGLDCCEEPDALVIAADGTLSYRGEPASSLAEHLFRQTDPSMTVRLLPDADLPAQRLLVLVAEAKASGAENVVVLTEAQE